jgi:hypothetical protein
VIPVKSLKFPQRCAIRERERFDCLELVDNWDECLDCPVACTVAVRIDG